MNTFEVFFFLGSLYNWKQQPSRVSVTFPSTVQYAHIRYLRAALLCAFWGRRVCADVVYFGGRWEWKWSADIRWGVSWNPSILGFYNREIQLAEGLGSKSRLKKMYIFSFIKIPPIERTFCWGGISAKDFQFSLFFLPILFLNPSADFIPGMLQDWCGQKWANLLQRCFITN